MMGASIRIHLTGPEWPADRAISVALEPSGELRIEGQDLGERVATAFGAGNREYEWGWVVSAADVPAAVAAIGGEPTDDPLDAIQRWASRNPGSDPGTAIRAAGVPARFWSRVGD